MRLLILTLLSLFTWTCNSQDLIILRNGEKIDCTITKVDSAIIHYDFFKGERKLSSYVANYDIRSYKITSTDTVPESNISKHQIHDNVVHIDTSKYVKETNKWVNLITYSQRYGIHADGWSVQYYGYNLRNTSKWAIPIIFGFEGFTIHADYFLNSGYQSVNMSYFLAGISPFYKLDDTLFLKLGANLIFGEEELTDFYSTESSNTFFGLSPSQGIYFIPKSKVGIALGLSIYEKLLSSKVYKSDIGIKLDIGLKF